MLDYIDPIPPIRRFLDETIPERVYGNIFPSAPALPAVLVKTAGGSGFTRLLLLARANDDVTAMQTLIRAMNSLERNGANVPGIKAEWMARETNPIHSVDQDTGKPEAWCYLRLEHLEA